MPPAFALSQDQTLRFICVTRPKPSLADALSIRLRSPLSMQSTPLSRHDYQPIPDEGPTDSTPSAHLLPKDRCDCQRSVPILSASAAYKRRRSRRQGHPTFLQDERTRTRRRKDQNRWRLGPLPPNLAIGAVGVSGWAGEAGPPRCGGRLMTPVRPSVNTPFPGNFIEPPRNGNPGRTMPNPWTPRRKKGRHPRAPPSLGRKRPRKQQAENRFAAVHKLALSAGSA